MKLKHSPKGLELIQQRQKSDCGVACLAMLSGLLYEDAREILEYKRGGLYPCELLEALEDMGFDCVESKRIPKANSALVALSWENGKGHFGVWDHRRSKFLDPVYGVIKKQDLLDCVEIDHIWIIKRWRKL